VRGYAGRSGSFVAYAALAATWHTILLVQLPKTVRAGGACHACAAAATIFHRYHLPSALSPTILRLLSRLPFGCCSIIFSYLFSAFHGFLPQRLVLCATKRCRRILAKSVEKVAWKSRIISEEKGIRGWEVLCPSGGGSAIKSGDRVNNNIFPHAWHILRHHASVVWRHGSFARAALAVKRHWHHAPRMLVLCAIARGVARQHGAQRHRIEVMASGVTKIASLA